MQATDYHAETDGALLAQFAVTRSDVPFEELIRRHGSMVYNVCLRILGQTQDAEDATQAVFIILGQKASSLVNRISIAGWLCLVARNVAQKAREAARLRKLREREAEAMKPDPAGALQNWEALKGILDDEICALPEKYRLPIVLFHLENHSTSEAAKRLKCDEGTLRSRLSRGRDMLYGRLARRGAVLSVGLMAALISENASAASLPAGFAASTAKAVAGNAMAGGLVSAKAAAMAQEGLKVLLYAKLKIAGAVLAAASLLSTAAVWHVRDERPAVEADKPGEPQPAVQPVPTKAVAWTRKEAGNYNWTDAANWTGPVPNAKGAAADLNLGLQGRMTVNVGQPVTLGRLNIGDGGGKPEAAVTIAGNHPLTFEGASPGAGAFLNITQGNVPNGVRLELPAGIRLGGSSPLTVTIASPAVFECLTRAVDLNGNTFVLEGARRFNQGDGWKGVNWRVGSISGGGTYVQNGSGTTVQGDCPDFTGTLIVNNGDFVAERLPAVSQYVVAGAFMDKHKYPRGGTLNIREGHMQTPSVPPPPRLNPSAVLVFPGGGYFIYNGYAFDEMAYLGAPKPVVVEQLRQVQFLSGLSEIRMINGNHVSRSTTLLITDPGKALVRRQGATVLVGGDDIRSKQGYWGAMGLAEKLVFASGMSAHLKGAGGAPGTKNRSVIPWMTIGTIYHPGEGGVATYDDIRGVHPLLEHDEYDDRLAGTPDRNVRCDDVNLGANRQQTVNSLAYGRWGNSDIGAGSTLTITSGALVIGSMGTAAIGTTPGAGGTINFGPAEGVIWSAWVTPYGNVTIGSTIAGSGGLTKTANGTLVLTAANTYTGKTCVATGCLQVGDGKATAAKLGDGDVEVANGAVLRIKTKVGNAMADTATVTLCNAGTAFYGMMDLDSEVHETVGALVLDGKAQAAGTYGSKGSPAAHKLDNYFSGPGMLTVTGKGAGEKP